MSAADDAAALKRLAAQLRRPVPEGRPPAGHEWAPVPADPALWRPTRRGLRCTRRYSPSPYSRCQAPAVLAAAALDAGGGHTWAEFCQEHGFGRWVEGDQVLEWRAVRTGNDGQEGRRTALSGPEPAAGPLLGHVRPRAPFQALSDALSAAASLPTALA